ncbi:hypothetical protein HanHA300_Chr03g0102481 [Helianthus annuus]|nr:hypothetical protein HanHA300_Chr03g0102481 [Helianthus annuus]KAJ0608910.1 hypothetical protein HanHA89_Chr03g0114161 [Helianthus annuus]
MKIKVQRLTELFYLYFFIFKGLCFMFLKMIRRGNQMLLSKASLRWIWTNF